MLPRIVIHRTRERTCRKLSLLTKNRRYSDFVRPSIHPKRALRERSFLLAKEARQLINDAEAISSADASAKTTAQLTTELLTIVGTRHKEIELAYFEAWRVITNTRNADKILAKSQADEADTHEVVRPRVSRGHTRPGTVHTNEDYKDIIQLISHLPSSSSTTLLGSRMYERDPIRWTSPNAVTNLVQNLIAHGRSINDPGNKYTDLQNDRECFNNIITALRYRINFVCTENYGGVDNLSLTPDSNGHYALKHTFTPAEEDVLRDVVIKSIMRPRDIISLVGTKSKANVKVNGLSLRQLSCAAHHILNKRYPRGYLFGIQRTIDQIMKRIQHRLTSSAWRKMYDQFMEIKQQGLPAHDHEEWLNKKYEEVTRATLQKYAADRRHREKKRSTSSIDKD